MRQRILLATIVLLTLVGSMQGQMSSRAQRSSSSDKPHIWGRITNNGQGVTGVDVSLESYDDESCVKLEKSSNSADQKQALEKCNHKVGTVSTDAKGEYHFRDTRPGWYKLHISWILPRKPVQEEGKLLLHIGEYLILFAANERMDPPKYMVSALGEPFRFEGAGSTSRDLNFEIAFASQSGE